MLKGLAHSATGEPLIFLGLTQENIDRLCQGMPIMVQAQELDPTLPPIKIALFYGQKMSDLVNELREVGIAVPDLPVTFDLPPRPDRAE